MDPAKAKKRPVGVPVVGPQRPLPRTPPAVAVVVAEGGSATESLSAATPMVTGTTVVKPTTVVVTKPVSPPVAPHQGVSSTNATGRSTITTSSSSTLASSSASVSAQPPHVSPKAMKYSAAVNNNNNSSNSVVPSSSTRHLSGTYDDASAKQPLLGRSIPPPPSFNSTSTLSSSTSVGGLLNRGIPQSSSTSSRQRRPPPATTATAADTTDEEEVEDEQNEDAYLSSIGNRVHINEEYLKAKTGFEDLDMILSTELRLDTTTTVGAYLIGELMPSLVELRLLGGLGARIPRIRDLGSKYRSLKVLYVASCQLEDLAGLSAACAGGLEELYASFNSIASLSDLAGLASLVTLDVEGNQIAALQELRYLSSTSLRHLSVSGNPVVLRRWQDVRKEEEEEEEEEEEGESSLPLFLQQLLPQLEDLDDIPIRLCIENAAHHSSGRRSDNQAGSSHPTAAAAASGANASRFRDPFDCADLAQELLTLQQSIRNNGRDETGIDAMIEEQHRPLYSRQSTTSCAGARKVPNKASTAPTEFGPSGSSGTFGVGGSRDSHSAAATSGSAGFNLSKQSFLTSSVAAPNASSSLTSGAAISGSLAKSLRRRLPSLSGGGGGMGGSSSPVTPPKDPSQEESLSSSLNHSTSNRPILREHEKRAKDEDEKRRALAEKEQQVLKLLSDGDVPFAFAVHNDDGAEQEYDMMQREELLRGIENEKPKFLDQYKDMIANLGSSSDSEEDELDDLVVGHRVSTSRGGDRGKGGATSSLGCMMTDKEVLHEVAKLKRKTAKHMTEGLLENPTTYETLTFQDLGEDVEGVL